VSLELAQTIVGAVEIYAALGIAFAALFLTRGIVRVDPRVAGSPRRMRLLLFPGVAALWPLFARRWLAGSPPPIERNPHRVKAAAR
jgi:hypothetical protein